MQHIIVTPEDSDQRLDRYLRKLFPNAPLSFLYKMGRTKKVRLNGKKAEPEMRILEGDEISLYLSDVEIGEFGEKKAVHIERLERFDPTSILFEDEMLLVVNKPAGVNVHPGDHKTTEVSLIELIQDYLGNRYNSTGWKPSLAHRLDRDTSGALIIAKSRHVLNAILEELQSDKITKIYLACTAGIPLEKSGRTNAPLLRIEDAKNENKVRIDPAGAKAVTYYHVLASNVERHLGLLELRLETGRMHQIRVHLASLHCPVIGDKAYGDPQANRDAEKQQAIHRQLLHARRLEFTHPISKKRLRIEAPVPVDMQNFMNASLLFISE